jgi:hypothetical protein
VSSYPVSQLNSATSTSRPPSEAIASVRWASWLKRPSSCTAPPTPCTL